LAKDRTPDNAGGKRTGSSRAGAGGKGGRTRPAASVVAPQRPWGLIAGAVAVVVFAAAVITYAVLQVNKANEDKIENIDEIAGVETYDYPAGQEHVAGAVTYTESPPVGGPHAPPPDWADCTGTVYDVDTLSALVTNEAGRMLSPYEGLDSPISIQAWGHQLKVDSADDPRLKQFADFLTLNSEFTPEPGASCENPTFAANPILAEAAPAQ